MIFLGSLLLTFPSCRYIKQRLGLGEYSLKAAIKWAKQDSTRVADSLKRVMADKKVSNRTLPDSMKRVISEKKAFERTLTDSLMSIDDNNLTAGDPGPGYYIICGSFTNHDNAKLAAGKYNNEGFKTAIIIASASNGSRVELVSVKIFRDRGEAGVFLKEFQSKHDPDAWLYSGK